MAAPLGFDVTTPGCPLSFAVSPLVFAALKELAVLESSLVMAMVVLPQELRYAKICRRTVYEKFF